MASTRTPWIISGTTLVAAGCLLTPFGLTLCLAESTRTGRFIGAIVFVAGVGGLTIGRLRAQLRTQILRTPSFREFKTDDRKLGDRLMLSNHLLTLCGRARQIGETLLRTSSDQPPNPLDASDSGEYTPPYRLPAGEWSELVLSFPESHHSPVEHAYRQLRKRARDVNQPPAPLFKTGSEKPEPVPAENVSIERGETTSAYDGVRELRIGRNRLFVLVAISVGNPVIDHGDVQSTARRDLDALAELIEVLPADNVHYE